MHGVAVVILGLMFAGAAAADVPREIVVTGEGRVDVAPDLATVTAGVETQAETAEAALAGTAETMRAVLAALEAAGIARADLQTSQIGLSPLWSDRRPQDAGPPEIVGYVASNLVTVQVREIDQLGPVIDTLGAAGANRIQGIGFSVVEPRPHEDAAREQAVADARARAELYARAAGVGLGEVLSIRETERLDRPFPMRAQAEMAMDMPVVEGSITLGAMVEMVFALTD